MKNVTSQTKDAINAARSAFDIKTDLCDKLNAITKRMQVSGERFTYVQALEMCGCENIKHIGGFESFQAFSVRCEGVETVASANYNDWLVVGVGRGDVMMENVFQAKCQVDGRDLPHLGAKLWWCLAHQEAEGHINHEAQIAYLRDVHKVHNPKKLAAYVGAYQTAEGGWWVVDRALKAVVWFDPGDSILLGLKDNQPALNALRHFVKIYRAASGDIFAVCEDGSYFYDGQGDEFRCGILDKKTIARELLLPPDTKRVSALIKSLNMADTNVAPAELLVAHGCQDVVEMELGPGTKIDSPVQTWSCIWQGATILLTYEVGRRQWFDGCDKYYNSAD